MQNARTAHALAHWRFHLNEWVVDYLKNQDYCTAEKIVQRDGWTMRKRRKYANKIADRMEAEGEIKRLYRDFRLEVSTAQFANVSVAATTYEEWLAHMFASGQLLRHEWMLDADIGTARYASIHGSSRPILGNGRYRWCSIIAALMDG